MKRLATPRRTRPRGAVVRDGAAKIAVGAVAALVLGCSSAGSDAPEASASSAPVVDGPPSRPIEEPCPGTEAWKKIGDVRDGGVAEMPVLLATTPFTARPPRPCVRVDAQNWFVVEVRSKRGPEKASEFALGVVMPALRGVRAAKGVRLVAGWVRAILVELDEDRARSHGVDEGAVTTALLKAEPSRMGRAIEGPRDVRVLGGPPDWVETLREQKVGANGVRMSDVATVEMGLQRLERLGAMKEDRVVLVVIGDRLGSTLEADVRTELRNLAHLRDEFDAEFLIGRSADEVELFR